MSRHNYTVSCAKDFINFFFRPLCGFLCKFFGCSSAPVMRLPESKQARGLFYLWIHTLSQAAWYSGTGGTPMILSAPVLGQGRVDNSKSDSRIFCDLCSLLCEFFPQYSPARRTSPSPEYHRRPACVFTPMILKSSIQS
jgi:hypothetical protein